MGRIPGKRIVVGLLLTSLAPAALAQIEATKMEPEEGTTLGRPPRHLRVWFAQEPDLSASELQLEGPNGELELEGLHTMGEQDLMIRIVGRVPDGAYTARWKTAGDDGEIHSGEWTFIVKRGHEQTARAPNPRVGK